MIDNVTCASSGMNFKNDSQVFVILEKESLFSQFQLRIEQPNGNKCIALQLVYIILQ